MSLLLFVFNLTNSVKFDKVDIYSIQYNYNQIKERNAH